jgi:hypothetical protein
MTSAAPAQHPILLGPSMGGWGIRSRSTWAIHYHWGHSIRLRL